MVKPLITVYITNYNYERYIEQAIQSVLNQSFQDFELLIIDDGSTDDSKTIIESYSDHPKIQVIYQKNKGLNITNNIALKLSKGKYIMRLDADDYLDTEALKKMVDYLEADPELGMVFPDYYIVDSGNNIVSEIKRHDFKKEVTIYDQPAHGACTMIRVKAMKAVGGYDESYTCQDGYELWIKFISKFKVASINETLFSYRRHNNNLTNNELRILDTRLKIKDAFVQRERIPLPKTAAVIPIRPNYDIALENFNGSTFLDRKIASLQRAKNISKIIVASSDPLIEEHIKKQYGDGIDFFRRSEKIERINISLLETLAAIHKSGMIDSCSAAMFCSVNYPFVDAGIINDAVNTLSIFNADSLIGVRPEGNTFFRHTGQGMQAILKQDSFTRLERESLYKYTGGVLLTKIETALSTKKLIHGNVGHIVISEKAALNVESAFEKQFCLYLVKENEIEVVD
ncbi:glycosyltransferase family 2 protein [Poritiphilus flavus]|uniref:Glycosyltransferase n=1 Tax=Poritiphilus flavus TaxID=2697053 RepID=A0A6L9E889_9FLAO|nr:glycosyltransferase [Poritiphilus flavus]NAS10975.1 glycosyltransferase [Poritiphilus flavus]